MEKIEKLAEIFKALSDPTRLKIIKQLTNANKCCVNALTAKAGVSQSAVSQHLRVLKQVGLINGCRCGCHVHYTINHDLLDEYKAQIREILGEDFIVIK